MGEIRKGAFVAIVRFVSAGRRAYRYPWILLCRREDGKGWDLPGGRVEDGETAGEAAEREVEEETGLIVKAGKQIGVFESNRDNIRRIAYLFECQKIISGKLKVSLKTPETTELNWFSRENLPQHIATVPADIHRWPQGITAAMIEKALKNVNHF